MLRKRLVGTLAPRQTVHAHCDIPCGIYDPVTAQLAARTVSRMMELINGSAAADSLEDRNKRIRSIAVKEQHADLVKREVTVIWGDYFKPEHVERFPELGDLTWKILKQASKCKQGLDQAAADELEAMVRRFAEIFWATKGQKALLMVPAAPGAPKSAITWELV